MSDEPVFPPEWGWELYEDAFREYAAQDVVEDELYKQGRDDILSETSLWREEWTIEQENSDRLPPFEDWMKRGVECFEAIQRLRDEAYHKLKKGELEIGREHITYQLEKMQNFVQENEQAIDGLREGQEPSIERLREREERLTEQSQDPLLDFDFDDFREFQEPKLERIKKSFGLDLKEMSQKMQNTYENFRQRRR